MTASKFNNTTLVRIGSQGGLTRPLNPIQLQWLKALGFKPTIRIKV